MSTTLFRTVKHEVLQHAGPERADGGDRRMITVYGPHGENVMFTRAEFVAMVRHLSFVEVAS